MTYSIDIEATMYTTLDAFFLPLPSMFRTKYRLTCIKVLIQYNFHLARDLKWNR